MACFASSSERQKRQRYFKACCTRRSYIFRVFSRYICFLHTSINYTENVRIFTRMRKQWIPGALLRFFKRLGTRLLLRLLPTCYHTNKIIISNPLLRLLPTCYHTPSTARALLGARGFINRVDPVGLSVSPVFSLGLFSVVRTTWFVWCTTWLVPGNPFAPLGLNCNYDIHSATRLISN